MRFLSLFTGIGGFDLGLERAGMECVGQVENDPFCIKVLKKHWPDVPRWGDIKDVTAETLAHHDFRYQPKKEEIRSRWDGVGPRDKERGTGATTTASTTAIDLICGGFPCQPWSAAGKRGGTEDDRDLWPEMLRIIEIVRPRWVIGENVRGFVSMEMGLDRSISDLENIGYAVQPLVIPACAVDAPHRRDRCWIVARDTQSMEGKHGVQPENQRESTGGVRSAGEDVADATRQRKHRARPAGQEGGRQHTNGGGWLPEPDVGRVAHGIPQRVDRLKCLGNAVVPQVVERIGCAILESEG